MGISLYVTHPTWGLSEAAEALSLQPFRVWTAGQPRQTPTGRPLPGIYDQSYICLRLQPSSLLDVEHGVHLFLEHLRPARRFLNGLTGSGGNLALNVFISSDERHALELNWQVLQELATFRVSFGVEWVPPVQRVPRTDGDA